MISTVRAVLSLILFAAVCYPICAQPTDEGREALQQVYNVLSGKRGNIEDPKANLERGAWEALSYLPNADSTSIEDLSEAVPDYYSFKNGVLILKLIDQQNINDYGVELKVEYEVADGRELLLRDRQTKTIKDRWEILYLDRNYLALDMGDLRVFFTHTQLQE